MPVDLTGRELKVGQRIAYPVRKSSAMWLCTARIESIVKYGSGHALYARNPKGRGVRITSLERTVILPEGTPK